MNTKIRDITFMADQVKTHLAGKWIVEKAENVEAYLKELGKHFIKIDIILYLEGRSSVLNGREQ